MARSAKCVIPAFGHLSSRRRGALLVFPQQRSDAIQNSLGHFEICSRAECPAPRRLHQ